MSVACPLPASVLDSYAQGMLNAAQRETVESHLSLCPACVGILEALEGEREILSASLRQVDTPPLRLTAREMVERYALRRPEASALPETKRMAVAEHAAAVQAHAPRMPAPGLRRYVLSACAAVALLLTALLAWGLSQHERSVEEELRRVEEQRQLQARQKEEEQEWRRRQEGLLEDSAQNSLRSLSRLLQQQEERLLERQAKLQAAERLQWVESLLALRQELEALGARRESELVQNDGDRKKFEQERGRFQETLQAQRKEAQAMAEKIKAWSERLEGLGKAPALPASPSDLRLLPDEEALLAVAQPKVQTLAMPLRLKNAERGWVRKLAETGALNVQNVLVGPVAANISQAQGDDPQKARLRALQAAANRTAWFAGPAAKDGRVFVGNGWSGKHLLAFEGATGKPLWSFYANDNGAGPPALSEDGSKVTFTTESCSVYALDSKTGRRLWSRWVGDPALTQPAVAKERIYLVHKNGGSRGVGDGKSPYTLTCLGLSNGSLLWCMPLSADALTSPVIAGEKLFVATLDGALSAYEAPSGKPLWSQNLQATSAPLAVGGKLYYSSWSARRESGFEESLCALNLDSPAARFERFLGPYPASYFVSVPIDENRAKNTDYSEESGTPGDLEEQLLKDALAQAVNATPALLSPWGYLGARPTVVDGACYVALGDRLVCAHLHSGRVLWEHKVSGHSEETAGTLNRGQPVLTPPSYADGKIYLGSAWGDLLCVDTRSGKLLWRYRIPESQGIVSQVVLDKGCAYATTQSGLLVCLDTGDPKATGWPMWGGSPGHNGPAAAP